VSDTGQPVGKRRSPDQTTWRSERRYTMLVDNLNCLVENYVNCLIILIIVPAEMLRPQMATSKANRRQNRTGPLDKLLR
jgi:hypothetical protein